ncbi:MAG TPA: hypothetical protein VL551_16960 [Actinospica sp.]|nr:hypothetical protein [Actinospica sp.]
MSAFHVDPAYLDVPWVAHVPRKAVLLRMCVPCWEDACWDCAGGSCLCACETRRTTPAPAPRHRKCGYLRGSVGCMATCEPERLDARISELIAEIGAAA